MPLRSRVLVALPLLGLTLTACLTRDAALPEPPPPPRAIVFHDDAQLRRAGAVSEYLRDGGFKTQLERASLTTTHSRRVLVYGTDGLTDLEQQVRESLDDFPQLEFRTYPTPGPEDFDVVVWLIGADRRERPVTEPEDEPESETESAE